MIICLTGMPGSGKTTVAEMLRERGFEFVEMHDAVNIMMEERGIERTFENRERFALDMRTQKGRDVFAVATAERVKRMGKNAVINGVRDSDEIDCIKRILGDDVVVVAITAPPELRYERIRKTPDSWVKAKDRKAFEYRDETNRKMGVEKAMNSADFVIANTGTVEELKTDVESVLREAGKRGTD